MDLELPFGKSMHLGGSYAESPRASALDFGHGEGANGSREWPAGPSVRRLWCAAMLLSLRRVYAAARERCSMNAEMRR